MGLREALGGRRQIEMALKLISPETLLKIETTVVVRPKQDGQNNVYIEYLEHKEYKARNVKNKTNEGNNKINA
jgi:hypothetical protein